MTAQVAADLRAAADVLEEEGFLSHRLSRYEAPVIAIMDELPIGSSRQRVVEALRAAADKAAES